MHELSIAQSLLDIVQQEAARHGVSQVVRVGVRVGVYSAVVPSSLTFCWDMIKEGTVAASSELVINQVPLTGLCQDCGHQFTMAGPADDCPQCSSSKVEMVAGRELNVDYIETAEPEPGSAGE